MKIRSTVSLIALTLTLAACGGGAEEADDPVVATSEGTAVPAAVPVAEEEPAEAAPAPAAEDGADDAQQDEAADAAPTPSPAASASPAAEAAAPAPAPAAAAPRPPMFAMCAACHSVDPGKNGIGPSLAGVFGAKAGHHIPDFNYSQAMKDSGLTWDEATLHRYLENPRQVVPGTTMAYAGLKNDEQRQAVIDYLKGL